MSTPDSAAGSGRGVGLEYESDGFPVVMKVMEDFPPETGRRRFKWLMVISWRYDVSDNNGMPDPEVLGQMVRLESSIDILQENQLCVQVYSKTGNGLKELVYYIGDRDIFMHAFNQELAAQPRYPLQIEFFHDPEWGDLQTIHRVFFQNR